MSSALKISPRDIPYFHRDYANDVNPPKFETDNQSWVSLAQRTAFASLPFFSLYKPFSFPLALGMGAIRVFTSALELRELIQKGNTQEISVGVLNTTIAVASLVSTTFFHPIGMVITTTQDIVIDCGHLVHALRVQNYKAALERTASIVNNSLYLSLFIAGSLELTIASFAFQAALGLYCSLDDFNNDRWIEGSARLLMSVVRVKQAVGQFELIQVRNECTQTITTYLKDPVQITKEVKNSEERIVTSKIVSMAAKASKYYETYNVRIQTANGYNFHVADYSDGTRVVTCLDGEMRGLQGVAINGVVTSESYNVTWYSNYFTHRHTGGTVTSWVNRQVIQLY